MRQSQETSPTNLPRQLNKFIGREQEMIEVKGLLHTTQLLTLTGVGGCGKTRLALQIGIDTSGAETFTHGVWWIELADLTEPDLIPQQIASSLGIVEQAGRQLTETLSDFLQSKQLFLILDNCEHLISVCAQLVETLLRTCPSLRILATSREALNITGELVWLVPSLALPETSHLPPLEELGKYGAIQLFTERATAVVPSFKLTPENAAAVLQVCQRLDGIPLATELAAARVKVLSVEQIAARLDDSYRLLTSGRRTALPRHQTLRATMDWSYSLLSGQERVLFRRLSVFAGGFTMEAVEGICTSEGIEEDDILDVLTRLVDKSLVIVEEHEGEVRYRLLETIRQYSQERLWEAGEVALLQERHWNWYTGLAELAEPELLSNHQAVWFNRLEQEHDNLRVALGRSLERGEAEIAARIGGAIWRFWLLRGHLSEGSHWLERVLTGISDCTATRAKALHALGVLVSHQGDYIRAKSLVEESLDEWRALGDRAGTAEALHSLGLMAHNRGDYEGAIILCEESLLLFRELRNNHGMALDLTILGLLTLYQGDTQRAREFGEEGLYLSRELGDIRGVAGALTDLGIIALEQGDSEQARALCEESLAIRQQIGDKGGCAHTLFIMGQLALKQGDYEPATRFYKESLVLRQETGEKEGIAAAMEGLASIAGAQGQAKRAAQIFGAAAALRNSMGAPLTPIERVSHERTVSAVRTQLNNPAFAKAWAEGQAMALEQAVEVALQIQEQVTSKQVIPTAVTSPIPSTVIITKGNTFGLTTREIEVLQLVSLGLTDAQIAEKLIISPRTVEAHVRSFLNKLGVSSRTAATRSAIAHKLVVLDVDK